MYSHLQRDLKPTISKQEYENLSENYQKLFLEEQKQTYACFACHEQCINEVFFRNGHLSIDCPSGYLGYTLNIDPADLITYRFSLKKLAESVQQANDLITVIQEINGYMALIGEKKLNHVNYKIYYMVNLSDDENKIKTTLFSQIAEIRANSSVVIITPNNLNIDTTMYKLLKSNLCEIYELNNLIENNYQIDLFWKFNDLNKNRIIHKYNLILANYNEIYVSKLKRELDKRSFQLLKYLAQNLNIYIDVDECINDVYGNDYYNGDKAIYDSTYRIKKIFKDTIYEKCLKRKNKCLILEIPKEDIFIADRW